MRVEARGCSFRWDGGKTSLKIAFEMKPEGSEKVNPVALFL